VVTLLVFFVEGGVEGQGAGLEVDFLGKGTGFFRTVETVHAAVFPLDGEGTCVGDVVEGNDDFFEVDVAVTKRTEVPEAAGVGEVGMSAKYANIAISVAPPHVFHVHVVDAVGEVADELHVIDALVTEVRRVVVEAEAFVAADSFDGTLGGSDVEGDFGGVDFEGEVHVQGVKSVEDWAKAIREIFETFVPVILVGWWEGVDGVPNAGSGESVNRYREVIGSSGFGVEEFTGSFSGVDHALGGTLANAFRISIAPDFGRKNGFVTFINEVTDSLADKVIGDGETLETVVIEDFPLFGDVVIVCESLVHVKVVPPAGELQSVKAHFLGFGSKFIDGKVGPLAGEEGNGSSHFSECF